MPLLFVLAGISTKYALQKRTVKEYLAERVKRLLFPFLFGTIVFMPIMSYVADKFNYSYNGGFFQHYVVFYTKFTDLTGADGGLSVGQFWFLLYLFVISIVSVGVVLFINKFVCTLEKSIPFWSVFILGLPLPLFSELLSVGGKSLVECTYLFLVGYYVFSDIRTIEKAEKNCLWILAVGISATILNVYLFIWADTKYSLLNTVTKYISEWIMVIALIGLAKRFLDFKGKVSNYMNKRSFLFYSYHFIWVVLFQYLLYAICGNQTLIIFISTILLSYFATFICCAISIRIPLLCLAMGVKYSPEK